MHTRAIGIFEMGEKMRKFSKGLAIVLTASIVLSGIPAGRVNAAVAVGQQYATVTDAKKAVDETADTVAGNSTDKTIDKATDGVVGDSDITPADADGELTIDADGEDNLTDMDKSLAYWSNYIDFTVNESSKTLHITKYKGTEKSITFPSIFRDGRNSYQLFLDKDTDYGVLEDIIFEDGIGMPGDSSEMFMERENLKSIYFGAAENWNVTNTASMFDGCTNLESIDMGQLTFDSNTDMNHMFCACKSLTYLNISSLKTSKVTDMCGLFAECSKLESVSLSGFDCSKVEDMSYMFSSCYKLSTINGIENLDCRNVLDMSTMFFQTYALEYVDTSLWPAYNLTNVSHMFNQSGVKKLDLSGLNLTYVYGVNNYTHMLFECNNLEILRTPKALSDSINEKGIDLPKEMYRSGEYAVHSSIKNMTNAVLTTKVNRQWYDDYTFKTNEETGVKYIDLYAYNGMDKTVKIPATAKISGDDYKVRLRTEHEAEGFDFGTIKNVSFEDGVTYVTDVEGGSIFGFSELASFDMKGFDVKKLSEDENAFLNSDITVINMSNVDMTGIEEFNFPEIGGLVTPKNMYGHTINLAAPLYDANQNGFIQLGMNDSEKILTRKNAFEDNWLSDWDFFNKYGKVNLVRYNGHEERYNVSGIAILKGNKMYPVAIGDCDFGNIKELGFSYGTNSGVGLPSFAHIFGYNLENVSMANLEFDSADGGVGLFKGNLQLLSVDFEGIMGLNYAMDLTEMFADCEKLCMLRHFEEFSPTNPYTYTGMFRGCKELYYINLEHIVSKSKGTVTDVKDMFRGCSNLLAVDFGSKGFEALKNADYMFAGCSNLEEIDLSILNLSKVSEASNMLSGCDSLHRVVVPTSMGANEIVLPHRMFELDTSDPYDKVDAGAAGKTLISIGDPDFWPFNDVAKTDVGANEIKQAFDLEVVGGYGTDPNTGKTKFKPGNDVTRAQFAIMLFKMAKAEGHETTIGEDAVDFPDVPATAQSYEAVAWASSNKIISGFSSGVFKPNNKITRAQITIMLSKYAEKYGVDTSDRSPEAESYPDYTSVDEKTRETMSWAIASGIMSGKKKNGVLCIAPKDNATRAQCAMFVMRYYNNLGGGTEEN